MVKPTVVVTAQAVKKKSKGHVTNSELAQKVLNNETFKTLVLLNTANRWAKGKYKFNGDLSLGKINKTGKSFKLIIKDEGKPARETTKYYSFCGTGNKTFFVSPSVFRK